MVAVRLLRGLYLSLNHSTAVRLRAAAATFTRRSLDINSIMERATLQQLRNLRTGMLLYMMRGTIVV